ncbi:hypothetical protein ACQP1K_09145 [Sphaerimonospora sp. CA-214678]|uniref:hypothetical protein n=1 Tax=Sphaerimonospora sp. CA-214678 TaxID=3240029 RepID=UPI003D9274D2
MIKMLHQMGLRSNMMYGGGFISIGASIASWFISKQYENAGTDRADRWGLFIGEWAPTFFALGVALRMEELSEEMGHEMPEFHEEDAEMRRPARTGA